MPLSTARATCIRLLLGVVMGLALGLTSPAAGAFEFFDGRLQVHGFYEAQLRSIARDFDTADNFDLTQWYNILNIEIEADISPDGFGPFDLLEVFARVETRYDCVWNRGCGLLSSADSFGNRADRSPKRFADGRRAGFRSSGTVFNGDTRAFRDIPRTFLDFKFRDRPDGRLRPSEFFTIQGLDTLFDTAGQDEIFGNADDPAPFFFDGQIADECLFNFRKVRGSFDGIGSQIMGPWGPECRARPLGALAGKPHPLSALDVDAGLAVPVLFPGQAATPPLPFRPVPALAADSNAPLDRARGIYYPNAALAGLIRRGEFDAFDQNFRQAELEWNHGASQQDEKELKELYFDMEFFDSRLWIRAGKQQIVWGKTELFRNQDQWNPQDLALASLPSLEESRIGLWAMRGVWSFYQVGPLEDVRLEMAALFDQFEPTDLGRCGEPYTPNPVCNKTLGLFIHGLTGFGVAGEVRPPDPWNDVSGVEVGARMEWRWERFSFALSDYYGYTDLPYQDEIFRYSRNVDPSSGRPRRTMATGPCTTGAEPACLDAADALTDHHANQQLFHMICSTSIGLNSLDRSACGQSVFNSRNNILTNTPAVDPTIEPIAAAFVSNLLAANDTAEGVAPALTGGVALPLVDLVPDPADAGIFTSHSFFAMGGDTLNTLLTDQQEALLGCGPFYGSDCELSGIDLMNGEASALLQSFPGFEGSFGVFAEMWDTTDAGVAQPGTLGFDGGTPCGRDLGGSLVQLPGCRGPGDPGYDVLLDGSTGGAAHPFTGQLFTSEMAIVSWNALMGLVALSSPEDPTAPAITEFDEMAVAGGALRTDGCSFARPNFCGNVQSIFQVTGVQRNTVNAGGNGRFGRRDWVWHGGRDVALRYEKRNILGFSLDFAEDITKSSWGLEFTWQDDLTFANNNSPDGLSEGVDTYNLTVSVDRPTFINFLNANRTFFINSQVFMRYVDGYQKGFPTSGPWTFLGVLILETGYFDDRLIPRMTFVYDKRSNSGAFIPQFTYKFSADFTASFGLALFSGRMESRPMALSPTSLGDRVGRGAYQDFVENGLSAVRDRDEAFLRIRYSFSRKVPWSGSAASRDPVVARRPVSRGLVPRRGRVTLTPMTDGLRRIVTPSLCEPAAILAFEGWNDAGESASGAAQYVADAVQSVPLARIEPEEYLDLTVSRPEVRIGEGHQREIHWPCFEIRYGSAGPDCDLVTGVGPEPHFRWRRYIECLRDLLVETGVTRVALLGSYLADVLYSRPVRVVGFASPPGLVAELAIEPSGYEGPTGIVGVLAGSLAEAGIEVASLWVGLPHYIPAAPNPRGSLALVQKLTEYLGFRIDDGPLAREAAEFENKISEMVSADPALVEYVRELKRREFAQ